MEHTQSKSGRLITGTVLCRNQACPSQGRLHCRDVTGALSIGARFVVGYLLCSFLGNFSRSARKDERSAERTEELLRGLCPVFAVHWGNHSLEVGYQERRGM